MKRSNLLTITIFTTLFLVMASWGQRVQSSWAKELTWTQVTSPVPANLRRIVYGNGKFVAVGEGSTVLYSTDGENWSKTVIPGTCNLTGIAYGAGRFVALCGEGFAKVYTSNSGQAWDAVGISGSLGVGAVGYENGEYLLTGEQIWTSQDAISWHMVAQADNVFSGNVNYRVDGAGIAYGNGTLVAVGFLKGSQEGILYSKDNGITWGPVTLESGYGLRDVAFQNGVFRAVGVTGDVLESQDGIKWSVIKNLGGEGFGIGAGNGVFLYGGSGVIDDSGVAFSPGTHIWDIAFGKGFFVAVGDNGAILKSSPVAEDLSVPSGTEFFSESLQDEPIMGNTSATTHPIGIGDYAEGGSELKIRILLNRFNGPVDIYFGVAAPDILPGKLFLLTSAGSLMEYKGGLVPWKANYQDVVDETPFGAFDASILPPGNYQLYLLVLPAQDVSLENFLLYATSFNIQ